MTYCTQCGAAAAADSARFCVACGSALDASRPQAPAARPRPERTTGTPTRPALQPPSTQPLDWWRNWSPSQRTTALGALMLVGAALAAIGSQGTWLKDPIGFGIQFDGTDETLNEPGKVTLILALVAGGIALGLITGYTGSSKLLGGLGIAVGGCIAAWSGFVTAAFIDGAEEACDCSNVIGAGLIATIVGGVVVLGAGLLTTRERTAPGNSSRQTS